MVTESPYLVHLRINLCKVAWTQQTFFFPSQKAKTRYVPVVRRFRKHMPLAIPLERPMHCRLHHYHFRSLPTSVITQVVVVSTDDYHFVRFCLQSCKEYCEGMALMDTLFQFRNRVRMYFQRLTILAFSMANFEWLYITVVFKNSKPICFKQENNAVIPCYWASLRTSFATLSSSCQVYVCLGSCTS